MSMGRLFRALLKENKYLVTPGITTPLHAMILEKTGYKFVYPQERKLWVVPA